MQKPSVSEIVSKDGFVMTSRHNSAEYCYEGTPTGYGSRSNGL